MYVTEREKMEEEMCVSAGSLQYCSARIMSPEIVEIEEESKSISNGIDRIVNDVYVAVGKDDLDVLKWALDHLVSPGAKVFLVHVFPPITYIPTPVGRLSRSQLSHDQVRFYINEENNRRKNLLQKYIRLCGDAKVTVDTMLLETNETSKAILELIPVLNITNLVMGSKRPPRSRILRKRSSKGEFVRKNAPDYCEVSVVHDGKKMMEEQLEIQSEHSTPTFTKRNGISRDRRFFECVCFSGKFESK